MIVDCAIIGGGPAGLSAALVLGRARRSVLLIDDHKPRNAVTKAGHGYLTRDGIAPNEFRRMAREEASGYSTVRLRQGRVMTVESFPGRFRLRTEAGGTAEARTLLLAAGLKEQLPDIPGLKELYGSSLFNCPYCDGWELRDTPLVAVSTSNNLFHQAKLLLGWSRDLLVCTHGQGQLSGQQQQALEAHGVKIVRSRITAMEGSDGQLKAVLFEDGTRIARSGGFVTPEAMLGTPLGAQLGCAHDAVGAVMVDGYGRTTVPGVYAAGDTSGMSPSQVVAAAASGNRAAFGIGGDLAEIDFGGM
ncbi:NAD(P)/FAD-dependent oxidoreductase [Paenibacillus herberti]|uniref:Pyridine nucleotide-disulfide oxidoreductase n=1 Tax=Paenibacillus herberti TaxID=1619309 RepID=A0A229NW60_9BACL|nr:NAD(P)/FAD-dependent oxidoreductase [Paenibacillus herberti]OXM14092.1 pyridine nucleotide-disulfide oxidoreductase [Paenibacillus herberti]